VSIESFISALDHLLFMEKALYKLNTLLLLLLWIHTQHFREKWKFADL